MDHWSYILSIVRPHRRRMVLAMLSTLALMLLGLSGPIVMAVLIDVIVAQGRYDLLAPVMLLFLMVPLVRAATEMVNGYLITIMGQRLVFDIRLDLYRRVHRLSCSFLQNTSTGKLMERLRGDVEQLQSLLTNQTLTVGVQLFTGLLTVVVMLVLSPMLTVLVLAAIALYVVNYKWFVCRIRKVQRRYRRKMDVLSGVVQERLSANIAVKVFGNERRESLRFVRRNFLAERVSHRFRMLNNAYGITSSVIGGSTRLLVLLVGTLMAVKGEITFGKVTAMVAFTSQLTTPAIQLAELSNVIQQAKVSLDRIFELMRAEPDVIDSPGVKLPMMRGEVAFRNVWFHYKPDEPVLQNFNLHVRPRQMVAIVGHTGCGKTTMMNLLYRFYQPQSGCVQVDGWDISKLDTRWYRRHLAMVPQDPVVFDGTIAENVAYGRPEASWDEIVEAARMAELGSLIERLPQGLYSLLGEKGIKLSVGEKQRLCIARAILSDPVILLLDEATSSLDPQSEALIQLALKRVMAQRTCFVIAHRLSTIINADLIVVVDGGRVLEMGNHAQLSRDDRGRYRKMVAAQMAYQGLAEAAG